MKHIVLYTLCVLWLATFGYAHGQNPATKSQKSPARAAKPSPVNKVSTSSLATASLSSTVDPVCKMSLSSGVSDTAAYAGKHYGFCSKMCKDRFKQRPTAYVR